MDKAIEIVKQVAEALRVPAEQVWAALVAKQQIGSAAILVNLLIGMLVCGIAAYVGRKCHNSYKVEMAKPHGDRREEPYTIGMAIGYTAAAITSIIIVIAGTSCMEKMLTGFFAPEVGAVTEIASKLGK